MSCDEVIGRDAGVVVVEVETEAAGKVAGKDMGMGTGRIEAAGKVAADGPGTVEIGNTLELTGMCMGVLEVAGKDEDWGSSL
ncbi:hypothetical protein [Streptomyces canus]|uniref:hypothetical protein n=1 Tax=Streptomyces canus TaxID=58343 RepID=UPI002DD89DC6|nr:hypothetical protein [Streptomyces canus]WSD83086.1 hypothetical protein OG925_01430 [Streptomyces canus]